MATLRQHRGSDAAQRDREAVQVRLRGLLGKALARSCSERLKKIDYRQLADPFRFRNEADNAWRCEFWGKVVRSAILTNCHEGDRELAGMIEAAVRDILSTQTPDGCVSSYPAEKQLGGWDVWGRKYVLLALLRYYDLVAPEEAVRNCCVGMLDHLMTQLGPGKRNILECGCHGGLAASSILGAVVGVYRITGEERFLDFARCIVRTGCSQAGDIFAAARAGTPPKELGNGKAYEMTSCFQGLAELYRFDPRPEYREACEKYFAAVRDREIFITGVGGGKDLYGEYWDDGARQQTASGYSGGLGETCVTTTWLHYCERIAELTDFPSPMEEAERALYNGILGAMAPDGTHWTHCNPTPLTGGGCKLAAPDQIERGFGTPFGGHDCCRAQGPEALALAPRLAVTRVGDAVSLNFFEPLTARIPGVAEIEITGNYPLEPKAEIRVAAERPFELRIRIPSFLRRVTLNGLPQQVEPGTFLQIVRAWKREERLTLEFDLSVRETPSPDGRYRAFLRGPLVLAEDSRGDVPGALCRAECNGRELIDYISAGNGMCKENTLQVWFPAEDRGEKKSGDRGQRREAGCAAPRP